MNTVITAPDKNRFEEIRKSLSSLGSKEATFLKVELLFHEALTMAKAYGNDLRENFLLAALRKVQLDAYEKTKEVCRTKSQKERLIHHFVADFKKAIAIKQYYQLL